MHFDIVQVGCGGNGGYITQRLAKLISSLTKNSSHTTFDYTLVDLDRVEEKNLQRQPFLPRDLDKKRRSWQRDMECRISFLSIIVKNM